MRVMIDRRRCQGNAQCAVVAPRIFGTDDGGYGVVMSRGLVPEGEEASAQAAVRACPEQAIVIVEPPAASERTT